MDYTWGVPVQQAFRQQYGYGNHNQYPNSLTGYEQYYMGHPWMAGSYASMYPFGMPMPGNQHMSFTAKEYELDVPPAAKKARLDYTKEDVSYHNHTSQILNADESTDVPDSFELPIDANPSEYDKNNESTVIPEGFELNQSDVLYQDDSSQTGPLTSTLAAPLPPSSVPTPPTSPIKQGDNSLTPNNQTYDMSDQTQVSAKHIDQEQPKCTSISSGQSIFSGQHDIQDHPIDTPISTGQSIFSGQHNVQEQPIDTSISTGQSIFLGQHNAQEQPIPSAPFGASQVMVVLPDGSKSSIWDLQVPAAFSSYQQPASYYPNARAAPGPSRKRRSSGPKAKNNYCHLCEKSYESSYKLKLHMNAHTGERPFVCEFCGKGFARGPNLNAHRRVHTGEKPFTCNRCSRGFSHPSDRIVHMVTEVCVRAGRYIRCTGQGWECTSCDSGVFESREQADRHARQHETGKGLACPVCQNNYQGQKAHVLVKHVREYHPEYMLSIGL